MRKYKAGCISVATGSDIVDGYGTRWLSYVKAGDQLIIGGVSYAIGEVIDNHQLKLGAIYIGESLGQDEYEIQVSEVVPDLLQIQHEAAVEVDRVAGVTRLKYITGSPGQEATYAAKLADAQAYIAAGYPADATPYIWISSEAAAIGSTPAQLADLIVYTAGLWFIAGAKIEGERRAAKQAINASANAAEIYVIEQGFKAVMAAV